SAIGSAAGGDAADGVLARVADGVAIRVLRAAAFVCGAVAVSEGDGGGDVIDGDGLGGAVAGRPVGVGGACAHRRGRWPVRECALETAGVHAVGVVGEGGDADGAAVGATADADGGDAVLARVGDGEAVGVGGALVDREVVASREGHRRSRVADG